MEYRFGKIGLLFLAGLAFISSGCVIRTANNSPIESAKRAIVEPAPPLISFPENIIDTKKDTGLEALMLDLEKKGFEGFEKEIKDQELSAKTPKRIISPPREIDSYVNNALSKINPSSPIDYLYVRAVIRAESEEDPRVTSSKGAMGLMQLIPSTWRTLTKELYGKVMPVNLAYTNPEMNVEVGTYYLERIRKNLAANYGTKFTELPTEAQRAILSYAYLSGKESFNDPNQRMGHWHSRKVEIRREELIGEMGI